MLKILQSSLFFFCLNFSAFIYADEYFQHISQTDFSLLAKRSDVQIIDIRTQKEYNAGHIPNAINLPHKEILSGEKSLDKFIGKTLILYCHTGYRVNIIKQYLMKKPTPPRHNIFHLKGDFRAWQARGKPIVKSFLRNE